MGFFVYLCKRLVASLAQSNANEMILRQKS